MVFLATTIKPIISSESGAHEVWGCDNFVETRRNIWQNMFYGVAATFDWEIENLPENMKDLSIYGRVSEFFDGVNLEGEGWHSGMVKLDYQDKWKLKQAYLDDCISEDELADVVYLRSENKEKAMGVITNRRANYWTKSLVDTCFLVDGTTPATTPVHSGYDPQENDVYSSYTDSLQNYGSVTSDDLESSLRLNGMKPLKNFKIKYYSPYDQNNSLKEEVILSGLTDPLLAINYPDLDTLDLILFEVFLVGENFKNSSTDTTNEESSISRKPITKDHDEIKVYPNPSDGSFIISVENPSKVKAIYITNTLGQKLDLRLEIKKENYFNKTSLNSGVYFIEVELINKIIQKRAVID